MKVTVIGCSGSFAGPTSPASCYLVQAEHVDRTWNLLLDLGNGALGPLLGHLSPREIDAVVLSHLHPDHCVDLCGLYVAQRYCPDCDQPHPRIPVHGPTGTAERMARAYDLPDGEDMAGQFDFRGLGDGAPFQVGPFTITPRLVAHPVEAYGLRVEADGAALAYTGDTDTCDALLDLCRDAGLVLSDSAFVEGRDTETGIHLSARRAAQTALDAGGVERLVLTHQPPWNDPAVSRAEAAEVWPGEVELARAGASYDV